MTQDELVRQVHDGFLNHQTFAENTLDVRFKDGHIGPYRLQPAQLKLWRAVKKQRDAGQPVRIVYLKGRQVMVSSGTAGIFFQELAFHAGRHARIVAHESGAAGDIFDYYKTFDSTYRKFCGVIDKSKLVADAQHHLKWANGSWARIQSAANLSSGRSATVSLWHLSEFGFWQNSQVLMRGIMGSVPKTADSAVIVESTANGVGNEFHQLCLRAQDPANDGGWLFVFSSWHEHPEYQKPLTVPANQFQDSLSKEEQALKVRFSLSLEQLYWRRWTIQHEFGGDVDGFRQEYPADPEEAFIHSGRPRFSLKHLNRMPIVDDGLTGDLVVDAFGPHKIVQFVEINKSAGDGLTGELEADSLDPDKNLQFVENAKSALTVYRKPQQGHYYTIGGDTSEGKDINEGKGNLDPDYSVACVLDADTGEQVAKLRERIEPAEFGRCLTVLGTWYNHAFLVVEVDGIGLSTMDEILRQGYPSEMIYHRRVQADDLTRRARGRVQRVGWKTSTVTRPQMISRLDSAIREMSIWIRDPHTKQECCTFVIKPSGKVEGQTSCHDDEVFALGLAIVGIEGYPDSARQTRAGEVQRIKQYRTAGELSRGRR